MSRSRVSLLFLVFLSCLFLCSSAVSQQTVRLPLAFEPNRGQADAEALFLARTRVGNVAITRDGAILNVVTEVSRRSARIRFQGITGTQLVGESPTGGFANYYRSQDRRRWLTHLPLYSRVRNASAHGGIGVLFYGHEDQLEYDFEVSPGSSPDDAKFALEGVDHLSISAAGDLEFTSGNAGWRLLRPLAFQSVGGKPRSVDCAYRLFPDGAVGFALGAYDHSVPLTIDPVVQYSKLIGVNNNITVNGIQVDTAGDLIIAGHTSASNYPVVNGKGPLLGSSDEVFITKLDPTGNTILYSTYIPASGFSSASSLALDSTGNAYVAGIAGSSDFPLTSTSLGICSQFCNAGFVAKFATDGTMVYSTLLSSGQALPKGIAVDNAGSAYVAGLVADSSLQTVNAFEPSLIGQICTNCSNAFFAKLNPAGNAYVFASYFANLSHTSGETFASGIALDGSGNIFIAGQGDVPVVNPWQVGGAMFVAKFAPDGKTLVFSSGFGGSAGNIAGVAAGADGTLFLAGRGSGDFPFSLGSPHRIVQDNGNSMFAAALDPTLTKFTYSTYLGDGTVNAIAVTPANHLLIAGSFVQNLFPLTSAVVSDLPSSGFVAELDALGVPAAVTEFGGHLTQEVPTAVAADTTGNLFIAGATSSSSIRQDPIRVGGNFGQSGTSFSSFLAKISPVNAPQISLSTLAPFLILRNAGSADLHISSIVLGGNLAASWGNCGVTVLAGTSCVLTVTDAAGNLAGGSVTIATDAQPAVQAFAITIPAGTTAGTPVGDSVVFSDTPTLYPPQLSGSNTDQRAFTISNVGAASATINAFFANGGVTQTNDCPTTLLPGASCTVQATITAGIGQPSLRISYDNGGFKDFELFVPVTAQPFIVSTTTIIFGIQQINGVAIPRTVTVTNTSNNPSSVPPPSMTGDPSFTVVGNTCVAPLAAHASCAVAVQFNPSVAGTPTATLSLAGAQVQMGGQAEFNSVVQMSPLQLNFFPVIVHRAPVTLPLTLSNTSASPVGIAGFVFSLPDYSETDDCAGQVPANGSCSVQVAFVASAVGPRDATMTINFLGGAAPQGLSIAGGVGVTPLDVAPASLSFGSALIGSTSASQGVSLGNGRQGTPQAYTLSITGDFVISQNVCANPMPALFGCFIQISFAPTTSGLQQGTLTVTYPGITEQSVVTLNGTGVATAPVVALPATLDVGSTPVAVAVQQPLTISNVGNSVLTVSGFSLSGANAADFSVAPGQCSTVAAGSSCAVQVGFTPSSPLQRQAMLTISDDGLNNPHTLIVTGTGVGPLINLPGPTIIGQVLQGSSTTSQVLIGNTGNSDLIISSLTVTGANAADFKAGIGLCATVHAPSTCLISVTFTPTAPGTRTASIVLNDNQVGSPQSFTVTGNSLGSDYSLPTAVDFGNQIRGSSLSQVVAVTNSGNLTLSINSIVVTGDFSATHTCSSVAAGASCNISVTFSPAVTGSRTGTMTITDNTASATRQMSLTGNGTDFQLNGGTGPVSSTVLSGQTAAYNLSLVGSGGFTGVVVLACSGAPLAATCTVTPSSVQLSSTTPALFSVSVSTQRTVAALGIRKRVLEGFGFLALVPFGTLLLSRRVAKSPRVRSMMVIGLLLLVIILGMLGCGGGGTPTSKTGIQTTPPGTYSLTVTATSAGSSRQINLTLVVQ